ncbi:MAG: csuA [Deltaproteobacteria bacterium]|nr:csuA [Deltaproteobacteria bacterium]
MKKLVVLAAVAMFLMTGSAMAAGTSTVAVSATVLGSCTISGGTAAFGNLDPAGAGVVNAGIAQPQVTCTNGAPYTITDDDGLSESGVDANRMAFGANFIQYSFAYTATGIGNGGAQNIGLTASVLQADYINKPAGNYADTVTLSVLP